MTTEQLIQLITDEGDARVAAALSTMGYLVQRLADEPVVPIADRVVGTVRLVDAHGFPVAGARIKAETHPSPRVVEIDGATYHVAQSQTSRLFETDAAGTCAVPLLPGARVTLHIENGLARTLTVPAEDFDVLSLPSDDQDAYITPRKPYAPLIRNS